MPELPEVERTRRLIEFFCGDCEIIHTDISRDEKVIHTPELLSAALSTARLASTGRHGKWLWMDLSTGFRVYIHLGMSGWIQANNDTEFLKQYPSSSVQHQVVDDEAWPPKFTKFHFTIRHTVTKTTRKLAYTDPRRFGRIHILRLDDPQLTAPLLDLAPDAYTHLPPLTAFHQHMQTSQRCIKAVLLDQKALVSGVGNWIADEVLFQARIHPLTLASVLSAEEVEGLRGQLADVLRVAVSVNSNAEMFPKHWLFHYRWTNKKVRDVPGIGRISFVEAGGRTSAVVASLQRERKSARRGKGGKGVTGKEEVESEGQGANVDDVQKNAEVKQNIMSPEPVIFNPPTNDSNLPTTSTPLRRSKRIKV